MSSTAPKEEGGLGFASIDAGTKKFANHVPKIIILASVWINMIIPKNRGFQTISQRKEDIPFLPIHFLFMKVEKVLTLLK
jgi:hypothetical protein